MGPKELDTKEIRKGLWIGGQPPVGQAVADAGFDTLVLCAKEFQPVGWMFTGGVDVIRAPLDDIYSGIPEDEQALARKAAADVAYRLHRKDDAKILVVCYAGLNRSALVCGLTLVNLGWSPENAVTTIRKKREGSFDNPSFVRYVLNAKRPKS